jgi:hypothetical protein
MKDMKEVYVVILFTFTASTKQLDNKRTTDTSKWRSAADTELFWENKILPPGKRRVLQLTVTLFDVFLLSGGIAG